MLSPVDELTHVFLGPPTPKFLHIIVRSPPPTSECGCFFESGESDV
jgi:hypothetical protein